MNWFAKLKLSTKLSLLVAVFFLGFLVFAAFAYSTLARVKVNGPVYADIIQGKDLIADVLPPPAYIIESHLLVLQLAEAQDRSEIEALIARSRTLRREYEERHTYWTRTLPEGPIREAMLVRAYEPAMQYFEARDREFIPALLAGDRIRAKTLARGTLERSYTAHRRAVDDVVRMTTVANTRLESETAAAVNDRTAFLFGIASLIVLVVLLVAWMIVRSLVARLRQSSVALTSTATQISATSREQQATVNGYSASTTEIAAAVREISATSQELLNTMDEVTGVAARTGELAGDGRKGLTEMDFAMRHLATSTGSISSKLAVIREKANNINLVVTTITKVADQTNLLSVNAAIEAEKAGEAGLGFLVVAREIRRLADQSAIATLDIEKMVQQMQGAVSAGVMEMDKFSEEVRRGVTTVGQINTQLTQIIEQVQSLTDRFEAVNEGMRSQSQGASHINDAMAQLTEGARHTAHSLKEFDSATESLRQVVDGLREEISRATVTH